MFSKNQQARQKNQLPCSKALPINNTFSIRQVIKQDNFALFQWANDLETRNSSFHRSSITKHQHKKWFTKLFKERNRNPVLICLKSGRARVGVIRFTRLFQKKNTWEIHFTVAPKYRGHGFAKPMLENALRWFRQINPKQVVYAKVKTSNLKSLKVLQSIGFKRKKILKTLPSLILLRLASRIKNPVIN